MVTEWISDKRHLIPTEVLKPVISLLSPLAAFSSSRRQVLRIRDRKLLGEGELIRYRRRGRKEGKERRRNRNLLRKLRVIRQGDASKPLFRKFLYYNQRGYDFLYTKKFHF